MILEEIETKLKTVEPYVFYGAAGSEIKTLPWNYIVFHRSTLKTSRNKTSNSDYYVVTVVRENYIPDGIAEKIISAMESIPGMKLTDGTCDYNYARKPNTDMVIEMLSFEFVRARKC